MDQAVRSPRQRVGHFASLTRCRLPKKLSETANQNWGRSEPLSERVDIGLSDAENHAHVPILRSRCCFGGRGLLSPRLHPIWKADVRAMLLDRISSVVVE